MVVGVAVPGFGGWGGEGAGLDALAEGLGEEDGGGGGDVEAVGDAEHGDADAEVGAVHEGFGEAVLLAAEAEGDGAGEVLLEVEFFGVGGGREDGDAARAEPGEELGGGGLGDGEGEEGAGGGAHDVGVVDVGAGVADDDGGGAGGVGGAEDGAEVAGFLDGLADEEEGVGGEGEVGEAFGDLGADGEEAVGAFAVGELLEDGAGAGEEVGAEGAAALDEGGLVLVLEPELLAVEELGGAVGVVEGAADLAVAFDEHEPGVVAVGALAELDGGLDAGVGQGGERGDHAGIIAFW